MVLLGLTAYSLSSRVREIGTEHDAINNAIQSSNPEAARQAAQTHLQNAVKARLHIIAAGYRKSGLAPSTFYQTKQSYQLAATLLNKGTLMRPILSDIQNILATVSLAFATGIVFRMFGLPAPFLLGALLVFG